MQQTVFEFHISRRAREKYRFDDSLFSTSGNVVFANFLAARQFAHQLNAARDLKSSPEKAVSAGVINALGLIDELLHQIFRQYRRQHPQVMSQALDWLAQDVGPEQVDSTLRIFCQEFPPLPVYRGLQTVDQYLAASSEDIEGVVMPNRHIALEEMLMLWLANQNPAFADFQELFDDSQLAQSTAYTRIIPSLYNFFAGQPLFGPHGQNLIDLLLSPARMGGGLLEQLAFMGRSYGDLLQGVMLHLLSSLDMVREEQKPVFPPGPPGPATVLEFDDLSLYDQPERFSQDLDWMPNLVLLAKNTYVWLDQLARKYQRPIHRLDQIPEAELELLRRWGISGLWLIGLWERSPASQTIKQMRGNPDAVASAYSLYSYDIAFDLGGEEAYQVLRERAWKYGIRLSSDMVPNHMGIDSRWVIEHPDWFVQLPYSPFPTYTFSGISLSGDERVGIYLEDHYFDNSDAAVVFKRYDHWTGDERFIYHGNDGTTMPWNDTAQLNYLIPEVREAVIQTILHVARKFPIIRFDAAMTLAKQHYQRLWYPVPGSGGDIASRAEYGLTRQQFDDAFPEEFWRTVVDRVAQEAPDTLLLAEAFWMMEGYFVRSLGMHRVYNSAFMNMLRDEKNAEYRLVIKNTLEFDTEILKRFVNFMNNPDERTAVDQFGKGDKYFGVCTMLATLPGLPMIGHGQIEGFAEKYGMEFRFPKWHEQVDLDLMARHEHDIFPLLRRRYLFADAGNFLLFDFYTPEGTVCEDVFAYANRAGDERALVVYHNRFAETRGWINRSAAFAVKTGQGDEKVLVQRSLAEALGLSGVPEHYVTYRELVSGLEYLRPAGDLLQHGFYLELNAYRYQVFLDWHELDDPSGLYSRLVGSLGAAGVPSIDEALRELVLDSVLMPLREIINPGMLDWLIQNRLEAESYEPLKYQMALDEISRKSAALAQAVYQFLAEQPRLPGEVSSVVDDTPQADSTAPPQADGTQPEADDTQSQSVDTLTPEAAAEQMPDPANLDDAALDDLAEALDDDPLAGPGADLRALVQAEIVAGIRAALSLNSLGRSLEARPAEQRQAIKYLLNGPSGSEPLRQGKPGAWGTLFGLLVVEPLASLDAAADELPAVFAARSREHLERWLLAKQINTALTGLGVEKSAAARLALTVRVLAGYAPAALQEAAAQDPEAAARQLLNAWLDDALVIHLWLVHTHEDIRWFNKEAFEELVWWVFARQVIHLLMAGLDEADFAAGLIAVYKLSLHLLSAGERSAYRVDMLIA